MMIGLQSLRIRRRRKFRIGVLVLSVKMAVLDLQEIGTPPQKLSLLGLREATKSINVIKKRIKRTPVSPASTTIVSRNPLVSTLI